MSDKNSKSLKFRVKNGARTALDRPSAFFLIDAVNRLASAAGRSLGRLSNSRTSCSESGRVVILAPPGGGNIGDQALVESAIWNADGPVT